MLNFFPPPSKKMAMAHLSPSVDRDRHPCNRHSIIYETEAARARDLLTFRRSCFWTAWIRTRRDDRPCCGRSAWRSAKLGPRGNAARRVGSPPPRRTWYISRRWNSAEHSASECIAAPCPVSCTCTRTNRRRCKGPYYLHFAIVRLVVRTTTGHFASIDVLRLVGILLHVFRPYM